MMRIHWKPNPLDTVIEVSTADVDRMRDKLITNELKNFIYDVGYYVDSKMRRYDTAKAVEKIKSFNMKSIETEVDRQLEYLVADLAGTHVGDCTCVPCSCTKCWAEHYLDIDTIKGLGKHEASKIQGYFLNKDGTVSTIDEVLDKLLNYEIQPFEENEAWKGGHFTKEYYESWIPEWTAQAKRAHDWLLAYKNEHEKDF